MLLRSSGLAEKNTAKARCHAATVARLHDMSRYEGVGRVGDMYYERHCSDRTRRQGRHFLGLGLGLRVCALWPCCISTQVTFAMMTSRVCTNIQYVGRRI